MKDNKKQKVFVGMSGGVDSSVAAFLLKNEGYEVVGIFAKFWKENTEGLRKQKEEEKIARGICIKIGIEFKVIDLSEVFKKEIVDYFIKEYVSGRTPNPCIKCNRDIKFGILFKECLKLGADLVATGHYVKTKKEKKDNKNIYRLIKAKDLQKDQSYFLYNLRQNQLKKIIFPLGDYYKKDVKDIARKNGLIVFNKPESQEICFVDDKYYGDFLKRQKGEFKKGDIVDKKGKVLGIHQGLPLYTLGQRRDLRIGGTGPYYVVSIDYKKNKLVVSNNKDDLEIFSKIFSLKKVSWIFEDAMEFPFKAKIKTRYRMETVSADIDKVNGKIIVKLRSKNRAVSPGQSTVFYRRDEVIGGGIIDKIIE